MNAPHVRTVAEVLAEFRTSPAGLSTAEAAARLAAHGPNELRETISRPAWKMLLAQFTEPMILILMAAAVFALFLGDFTEAIAILAIVLLFGILGFIQEYRAEKAMAALKHMASPAVRVRRDGALREIPARDLVPGDVVRLEAGNIVPADLRLLKAVHLGLLEAALTGESEPVVKQTEALDDERLPLGDRRNLAFLGTIVAHGRGEGIVVETGMRTELGKIAGLIQDMTGSRTPLQRKLAQVGKHLSIAGLGAALLLMGIGLARGNPFGDMLLTAVSLLVAVVPEGLPAVITATLALGGRRMLKRHALIRTLPAVETLGSVTVICTDKTGTLTENQMTATRLQTLHREWTLSGEEAAPAPPAAADEAELVPLLLSGALCNDAHLVFEESGRPLRRIGDPTEIALLVVAERFGIPTQSIGAELPRIAECPFDSERKRMTTLHRGDQGDYPVPAAMAAPVLAAVKGSPDGLIKLAAQVLNQGRAVPLTDEIRRKFHDDNERLAGEGMRVLGIAYRGLAAPPAAPAQARDIESGLVFCGLVGMMDPPRAAVRTAIARSHAAGIRTVMITGDHPFTAAAIGRQLRLAPDGRDPLVLAGAELAGLTEPELARQADQISVYARVSPEDKLRIVKALQSRGHVVAMTGDGVNDAPALKRAEIGVAMGRTGTDVAKEAAAMVLLDDNYATLVSAIEEGRTIFDNLVRFIKYSFGGNLGKVLAMMLAPVVGIGAMALRPLHLLWLNLLTDGLMGLGLGLEPAEANVMDRPPRQPNTAILDRPVLVHVGWMGLFIAFAALALAGIWYRYNLGGGEWQTVLFSAIGFAQMGQAWGLRALTDKPFRFGRNRALVGLTLLTLVLQLAVIYVPALAKAFWLAPLSPAGLAATVALGGLTFAVVHLERRFQRQR